MKGRSGFTIALPAAVLPVCFLAFVFEADGHLVLLLLALGFLAALMEARICVRIEIRNWGEPRLEKCDSCVYWRGFVRLATP